MATDRNGVHRKWSAKGKGFWLAHWNGQEKVFYDGSYGTETSANLAAVKWVNDQKFGKGKSDFRDKAFAFADWLDKELEKQGLSEEVRNQIQGELTVKLELYQ